MAPDHFRVNLQPLMGNFYRAFDYSLKNQYATVMQKFDCIIVGTGPAGLGAAYHLKEGNPALKILVLDRKKVSSGGLRNDCKMNFTYPVGFPLEYWDQVTAEKYLAIAVRHLLKKNILRKKNLQVYQNRASRLGVRLLEIRQIHLGTDKSLALIQTLIGDLKEQGVTFGLQEEMTDLDPGSGSIVTNKRSCEFGNLILAPGRQGFHFVQAVMRKLKIKFQDNIVDIGLRMETQEKYYPVVKDYYDPKFLFPLNVRTFCTNSRSAYVVKERYTTREGRPYFSVNGHAFSEGNKKNNLVNFALLKTVRFTEPLASGQDFAEMLGLQAMLMGGGQPIMQRVGDFRLSKRSTRETFNQDLYGFPPTLPGCTPGDISLSMPAKILGAIWESLKLLDTIIPGILHPSTIMYYPEIKLYANKPVFTDNYFRVQDSIYMIGDGAGTSRGITAAWASGIRAAAGILARSQ